MPGELCKKPFVALAGGQESPWKAGDHCPSLASLPGPLDPRMLWMQSISQMPLDNFLPLVDRN